MKKHLTTILSFAMMMFMAFTASSTLTSCGEEVIIDDNHSGKTVFSASPVNVGGDDETRTSIDKNRVFYWQFNDQIWINNGGTWIKSSDSELSADNKAANFYYDKLLTAPSYEVVYTGLNSKAADKVTIPSNIAIALTGSTTIGVLGDCGVATATRNDDGTYSFALLHKASYLGVAPLNVSYLSKPYTWTKTVVTDVNGKAISGTFDFSHANGIDSTSVTSPSSSITLVENGIDRPRLQNYNTDINYVYTVLPPCHRELRVEYYFVDETNTTDTIMVSRKLNPRKFIENNVVQLRHGLTPDYYRWDAPKNRPYDATNNNANLAAPFTQATNVCATMPNPNEMYWYIVNGDPRWDTTTPWTNNGGATTYTGGVWIKKKSVILAEGKTFNSNVGVNGADMRTSQQSYSNVSATYKSGGKPADTSKYFFLPAQGFYHTNSKDLSYVGVTGAYWASTSLPENSGQPSSYSMQFDSNGIAIGAQYRGQGRIAGKGSDWFK